MPADSPADGLIWVEGGRIRVKNPGPGGKPAVVQPCPGVEVLVSGRKISGPEPVVDTTPLQVHFPDEQPTVSYTVQIAQGGLEASVSIQQRDGVSHSLKDVPPSSSLVIQCLRSPIPAVPSLESLLDALSQKGVRFGIDKRACEEACAHPDRTPLVVARGQPPVPGKDGEIQFMVQMQRVVDLPPDELRIDFREVVKMPDVKAGQVIALKKDPVPGSPGVSVTGAAIQPPRPKDPRFRAGKGVELRQDQPGLAAAVATISGCPVFDEGSGVISVEPVLTHKGDVDLSSGNMRSSGGITIMGNVTEGMKVECEGSQEISGTVTGATLKAWGSIRIRGNVFQSTITAGKDSSWVRTMDSCLVQVEDAVQAIAALEGQVRDIAERQANGEDIGPQDAAILDKDLHLERFRSLVMALSAFYKENLKLFPRDVQEQISATRDTLSGRGVGMFEIARTIGAQLSGARAYIDEELMKGKSDVAFPYAQSSRIEASRDIMVTGQGAFYCTMIAGRAISVTGSPGLLRGGEARARDLIQVNAAGAQGAAPTLLSVSGSGKIQAKVVYPNTVISVGRLSLRTENTIEAVKAAMQGDSLVISTSQGAITIQ